MNPETILDALEEIFPDAECELVHADPWQLAVAAVLSAQTTDQAVNKITPALFADYPDAASLAKAELKDVEDHLNSLGLYRNKAKSIIGLSRVLMEDFDGQMPSSYEELEKLPGVGRKSANVIRSVAFDIPSLAVDTHVERVSKRLGLARTEASVKEVEESLMEKLPEQRWNKAHHQLIFFGRYLCKAKKPECERCPFEAICQNEAYMAYKESRKNARKKG